MPDASGNLVAGDPGFIQPGAGLIQQTPANQNVAPSAPAPPNQPASPPVTGYTPATAAPAPYTAAPYTVAPEGTVQQRVQDIVAQDSPLMQEAKKNAMQDMNARGLLNSSLAVEAGQEAVIKQALPIASQDATSVNQAMTNTQNQVNAQRQFDSQLISSMNQFNAAAQTGALSDTAKAANAKSLSLIDSGTKIQLAQLDANNRQLLQTNVNAANAFSQVVTAIGNIQTNTTLDNTAKANAVASQINMLHEFLQATTATSKTNQDAMASLDLSQYFTGGGGLLTSGAGAGGTVFSGPPAPGGGAGGGGTTGGGGTPPPGGTPPLFSGQGPTNYGIAVNQFNSTGTWYDKNGNPQSGSPPASAFTSTGLFA